MALILFFTSDTKALSAILFIYTTETGVLVCLPTTILSKQSSVFFMRRLTRAVLVLRFSIKLSLGPRTDISVSDGFSALLSYPLAPIMKHPLYPSINIMQSPIRHINRASSKSSAFLTSPAASITFFMSSSQFISFLPSAPALAPPYIRGSTISLLRIFPSARPSTKISAALRIFFSFPTGN